MICFVFIGQKGLNKERGMSKLSTYRFFRKPYSFCHTMLTGDIHKWEKRKSPSLVCKLTFLVRKSIVICRFGPNSVKAWALTHVTMESKLKFSRNVGNCILFPKSFWPTMRKKMFYSSSGRLRICKLFEITRTIFKCLRQVCMCLIKKVAFVIFEFNVVLLNMAINA